MSKKATKAGKKQGVGYKNPPKHTQFKPGQSGNPHGRSKKFVTSLKAQGYKLSEINDCIVVMLSMTKEQLKQATSSAKATALEMMISAAILRAIREGNLATFETLASRTYGKPKETVEIHQIAPEVEASVNLYHDYREQGLTKIKALNAVIKGAKSRGFEITKDDILNATTIE